MINDHRHHASTTGAPQDTSMSATNGNRHGHQASAVAQSLVLVRYRPGITGETARTVHLVPLSVGSQVGTASALCGTILGPEGIEEVAPGQGMPCSLCVLSHAAANDPSGPPASATLPAADRINPDMGPAAAEVIYRSWGWPVTLRRDHVWLSLIPDTLALVIPVPLATETAAILARQRCPALVLAHPYAPEHWVLLAGERYPVEVPWPPGLHRVTGAVLLPPTVTARGPVTWVHPPSPEALQLCREIDVIAALRTALSEEQPG